MFVSGRVKTNLVKIIGITGMEKQNTNQLDLHFLIGIDSLMDDYCILLSWESVYVIVCGIHHVLLLHIAARLKATTCPKK